MASSNFFEEINTDSTTDELVDKCIATFDLDEDGALNSHEIGLLCKEIFVCNGESYDLPEHMVSDILQTFDEDKDEKIDKDEMLKMWEQFVVPLIKPKTAILIIDVQNDFIDGTLAVRDSPGGQEGKEVVPAINSLLKTVDFNYVFYSLDWHPEDHISFIDNIGIYELDESCPVPVEEIKVYDTVVFKGPPKTEQKLWPKHCVQNSWGSELHPELDVPDDSVRIYKGTSSIIDSYSAFWDNLKTSATNLVDELKSRNVTDVYVCGLAYDFCVGSSALHSLELGFKTVLVEDAIRHLTEEGKDSMKSDLLTKNAVIVDSDQVADMVQGKDRKPEFGLTLLSAINKSD